MENSENYTGIRNHTEELVFSPLSRILEKYT